MTSLGEVVLLAVSGQSNHTALFNDTLKVGQRFALGLTNVESRSLCYFIVFSRSINKSTFIII